MPVDKSSARVRRMFGEIAGRYDLMNHLLSMNVDRYWRWKTVRKLAPHKTDPILDVCTGTGDLAFAFNNSPRGAVPVNRRIPSTLTPLFENWRRRIRGNQTRFPFPFGPCG